MRKTQTMEPEVHSGATTPIDRRIRRVLLASMDVAEQPTFPQLERVIAQREQNVRMDTGQLPPLSATEEKLSLRQPEHTVSSQATTLRRWRRKVPVLTQMSAVECGAACLAMLLSYYGRNTSVSEVREHCNPGRDGLSALTLVQAAKSYGLQVRAVTMHENEDFRLARLPAIIHWQFNHFLIVEGWTPFHVDLVDPARGRRRITQEEFDKGFTGIVIMLEPGDRFTRHHTPPQVSLRTYVKSYIRQAPFTFGQIVGASLLLQIFGLGTPLLTEIVVDQIIPFQMNSAMNILGAGILMLALTQLVTTFLRGSLLVYLQARVDTQMMLSFFEHMLTLPLRFFQQRSSGDILSRLNSNSIIRDTLSNQLISTLLDGGMVIVYLIILLWQAPIFAILVLGIGGLQIVVLLCTKRPLHDLSRQMLENQGVAQGYAAEALTGIVTLKAAGAEKRALQHWSNLFFEQLNVSVRRNYLSAGLDAAMSMLRTFSPLSLLWIGATLVIHGQMQVGTMLALNALALAFLTPLTSLVSTGRQLQLVHSHLERIADVIEAQPEQQVASAQQAPRLTGNIALQNVSFRYNEHAPEVLRNINASIRAGQKVALVGRTGSGKSTLGMLLLGLYLPTQGEIFYDGVSLSQLDYQTVRAQFGAVMQEATIFSGSIRHNIAFNDPTMTLERVVRAAQMAALHDDILTMPMGYETFVSERGSALSGGQRQRLALARALAHNPVMLLLDEATSALDVITEQVIEQNLRALSCTQIIIAHRLSTIRNADSILVLDQGRITENGTHKELLLRNGYYARLIQSQLANGEVRME